MANTDRKDESRIKTRPGRSPASCVVARQLHKKEDS